MNSEKSYLNERLAERRRRLRSGVAGVGLLMALGVTLLLSYPTPRDGLSTAHATASHSNGAVATTLR